MAEPTHGTTQPRGLAESALTASSSTQGRFGRMFRRLPVFAPDEAQLKALAAEMIDRGRTTSADNPAIPAGYTYFGQFVDHDITFDQSTTFDRINDPDGLRNFRTPRFDLDCVYGSGPTASPQLYDRNSAGGIKLLVGANPEALPDGTALEPRDLPRNPQGIALIGDPRNDENVIVSQLQLMFIDLHNRMVDRITEQGEHTAPDDIFREANRLVRWHYQWVVIHDFLKRIAGARRVERLFPEGEAPKLRFYKPKQTPFMPVEFSVAAYRFGHSMIRPTYTINDDVPELPIFTGTKGAGPLDDFRGLRPLPAAWTVDWSHFFKTGRRRPQPSRKIDTRLAEGLFALAGMRKKDDRNLALRNLKRGVTLGLPSGRRVALAIGADPLTTKELGFDHPAPLWYYILREAAVQRNGKELGQVGANIVAEVFLGLLAHDPLSYFSVEPGWRPELPSQKPGEFTMADLIRFATGVTG
jgi:hypothetical protein